MFQEIGIRCEARSQSTIVGKAAQYRVGAKPLTHAENILGGLPHCGEARMGGRFASKSTIIRLSNKFFQSHLDAT